MIDQSQSRFPGPNWLNTQSIFGPVLIFSKRKLSSWVSAFSRMHLDCLLILSLQLHQKKLIKRLWFIKRLFRLLCQSFCSAEMHPVQINLFDSINISVWLMKEWIWFHVVISRLWGQYSLWGLGVTGPCLITGLWVPGLGPVRHRALSRLHLVTSQHSHCLPLTPSGTHSGHFPRHLQ